MYTKGEWRADELTMEEMTFKGPYVPIKAGGALMMFDGMVAIVGGLNETECIANAKLIAAAPALLKACEGMVCCGCSCDNCKQARAAIELAK